VIEESGISSGEETSPGKILVLRGDSTLVEVSKVAPSAVNRRRLRVVSRKLKSGKVECEVSDGWAASKKHQADVWSSSGGTT